MTIQIGLKNLDRTLKFNTSTNGDSETHIGTNTETTLRNKGRNKLLNIKRKQNVNNIRIIGGNINTFPIMKSTGNIIKREKLKHIICQTEVDIVTINEHNLNLKALSMEHKPSEITMGWRKKSILKFGSMDNGKDKYSYGGNAVISYDSMSKRLIQSNNDNRKLGRWTWCTYKGKQNKNLTIFSCYRPNESQVTYRSQLAKLAEKDDSTIDKYDNDKAWYEDIKHEIKEKIEQGDEVILVGDFNENLENSNSRINKVMDELNMTNILKERYGHQKATHIRGSECIDGMFATQGISMTQGGYIPFEWVPGDHRWIWADIAVINNIGDQRHKAITPLTRKTTSKIPSVKEGFNSKLNKQLEKYDIERKIDELERLTKDVTVEHTSFQELYETIDERFKRSVQYADKKCKKGRRGPIPFSDNTKRILGTYTLLKMILLRHRLIRQKGRPRMASIKRLAKKIGSNIPLTYRNEKEILEQCKINAQEYKELPENADEYRYTYLGKLAKDLAAADGKDKEWHLHQLKERERKKKHWANIKTYESRARSGGVTKVDIETDDGMVTVTDTPTIVSEIIKANGAKRLQANNTPFRTEPLRTAIGEKGNFNLWEDILNNAVEIPELDESEEGTIMFIKYLKAMKNRTVNITWTQEEYISSWKYMSEEKSSYPGIHTSHMKCINPKSLAARVVSTLALIPFKTGYCPQSWKVGIDSMIPKKDMKEFRPKKLRLILLMDVRFNHANKLIGKKIMEYGEEHGLLANEQFGSRKAKSALEHALNKRIILDMTRQSKSNAIYLTNDAKSCYDRILLMVAYMTMRRYGIPENVAKSAITGLIKMVCRIRTAHGDSKESYSAEDLNDFLHGIGQGNGYGPAIWAAISSIVFNILKDLGLGNEIIAPITKEILNLVAISFVDDTDSITIGKPSESWEELMDRAQKGLDMWECLIRTTGGAIEPSKSFWVGIKPTVTARGDTILQKVPQQSLWITGLDGTREELTQLEEDKANLGLGVWQAPNGQEDTQTQMFIKKINAWNNNVRKFPVGHHEGRSMINLTIGKKIRYPLAATALSDKQSELVTKTLTWAALGKAGVVRTASRLLVNAPPEMGGMGLRTNIKEMQMIDHIKMILRHAHRQTVTGKLIRVTAEMMSIEAGVSEDPFHLNAYELDLVTQQTWIRNTIEMLLDYDIQITSGIKKLRTWANEDELLIDNIQEFSSVDGKAFNKVRLYLQVATLSDVCTADFKSLDMSIFHGDRKNTTVSPSKWAYDWPQVSEVTRYDVTHWKQGLKLIFNTDDTGRLQQLSMRDWDRDNVGFFSWVRRGENEIYEKVESHKWRVWVRINDRARYRRRSLGTFTRRNAWVTTVGSQSRPITIIKVDETTVKVTHIGKTREAYDDHQPSHWTTPRLVTQQWDKERFINNIKNDEGRILAVQPTEGSNYACYVIAGFNVSATVAVPGDTHIYRQLLGGILSAVKYVNRLVDQYELNKGTCIMGSTNLGALKASFGRKEPSLAWSNLDLIDMIRAEINISRISWRIHHVVPHDDTNDVWMNAINEETATTHELPEIEIAHSDEIIIGERWKINIQYKHMDNLETNIRRIIYEQSMKTKWQKLFKISNEDMSQISWDTFKRNNKGNKQWKQIFMAKYNARILPVMKNLLRRKHSESDRCPNCGETETTMHLFCCKAKVIEDSATLQLQELEDFLTTTTSINIKKGVVALVRHLRYKEEIHFNDDFPADISFVVKRQASLGIAATLGGFWLQQWISIQKDFYTRFKLRNSAKTWLPKLVSKIQDFLFNLWLARNNNLHYQENSAHSIREHERLDKEIRAIYKKIPHSRTLSLDGRRFFKVKMEYILKRRRRGKAKWVNEATVILEKFDKELTDQSRKFISYFAPD